MKRLILLSLLLIVQYALYTTTCVAQGPNDSGIYYKNADGKSGAELKTALSDIINHVKKRDKDVSKVYKMLWDDFRTTDATADGKVWDMYSNKKQYEFGTDQAGNYSKEGDVYNREHSFPNSWFGGKVATMYYDLHHVYPTDGWVNGQRGNDPFGEVAPGYKSSYQEFSKWGTARADLGYTGKVFEPNDEYKGDFARTYFYMVTCYENDLHNWYEQYSDSRTTLDGNTYPGLAEWQLNKMDPISDKEINRNKAVYGIQENRNPFIDYPQLEELIWGDHQDVAFSYDHYTLDTNGFIGISIKPERFTDEAIYNMKGQRVDSDNLTPGIYIRNGRKFIVK